MPNQGHEFMTPNPNPNHLRHQKKRLLLVDDHPVARMGLASFLSAGMDLEICGNASDVATALEAISRLKPDLVLTDISMPGENGLEFIKRVRAQHWDLPILVVSMHDEALYAERVLRAGAQGYLMKDQGQGEIREAVRKVLNGQVYVSEVMARQLLQSYASGGAERKGSPLEHLTDREFEVFRLIGQGIKTRQIANQLQVGMKTIDAHRRHIRKKLNVAGGNALVRLAVRWVETEQLG